MPAGRGIKLKYLLSAIEHPKSIGSVPLFLRLLGAHERATLPWNMLFRMAMSRSHTLIASRLIEESPGTLIAPFRPISRFPPIVRSAWRIKVRARYALVDQSPRLPPEMLLHVVAVATRTTEKEALKK